MLCASVALKSYQQTIDVEDADLLELRLDSLPEIDCAQLACIISHLQLPVILTLRSRSQGGQWGGSIEGQLDSLASLHPDYLDVEYTVSSETVQRLRDRYPKLKLILSYHNFSETPANLGAILLRMRETPADIYKLATMAQTTADALRTLIFAKESGGDVLALAMGEKGSVSRILAPLASCPWSYASLHESENTAPGQLTISELREVYNYSNLSPATKVCGLFGDPISFSIGHLAHNACYQGVGLDAVYVKMHVRPVELEETLSLCGQFGFRGLSVTIPHKERVSAYLNHVDAVAEAIGAVNTVTFSLDGAEGSNSDACGALDAIEDHLPVAGRKLLIVGAGGSARSVTYEAARRGACVTVAARRAEQACLLAENLGVAWVPLDQLPEDYDCLINATPADLSLPLRSGAAVMDLRCIPRVTQLHSQGLKSACECIYGEEMFYRQAEKQLEYWFLLKVKNMSTYINRFTMKKEPHGHSPARHSTPELGRRSRACQEWIP